MIDIGAISHIDKPKLSTDNVIGDTGGLVSGAGGYSHTYLTLNTSVNVGDRASLQVVGITTNNDVFVLHSLNDINAYDSLKFTTAGALSGASAESTIEALTDVSQVAIGHDANLISSGALDLSARGQGGDSAPITAKVNAETYGAGTVTLGQTLVDIRPQNSILISPSAGGGGTNLTADGDLNLTAGRGTGFAADQYSVESRYDGFAGSLIPISNIDSKGYVYQQNVINVGTGAVLDTARTANLFAERLGIVDIVAKAKATSWASTVSDWILSLTGGGGEAEYNGHLLAEAHGLVQMDGAVHTGLTRHVTYTFDTWDPNAGTVTGHGTDGVTFTVSLQALQSSLVTDLNNAKAQIALYGDNNSTLRDFYQSEIDRITAELISSGLANVITDSNGVVQDVVPITKYVMTIVLDPIWAEAGQIWVRADELQGSGVFDAPGDASVTITNATPAFLQLKGITIPETNGGMFYDGILAEDNSTINQINLANAQDDNVNNYPGVDSIEAAGIASFSALPQQNSSAPPTISVKNTLDVNNIPGNTIEYSWPDLTVLGASDGGIGITNYNGNVDLETYTTGGAKGNVIIQGPIHAANETIIAGGNFYLDGVSTKAIAGAPDGIWGPATTGTYNAGAATAPGVKDGTGYTPNPFNYQPQPWSLLADRIYINAEYLDINGIMQSGQSDYNLTLGSITTTEVQNVINSGLSGKIFLPQSSNIDFGVYYDTASKSIVVEDVSVGGGNIDLTGHVLNSGSGQINVLGGYGKINITNNTVYNVRLNRIDDSNKGAGSLIIKDKSLGTETNPFVTVYQQTDNGLVRTTNDGNGNVNQTNNLSANSTYQPALGWRYGWTVGVTQDLVKKKHIESSDWAGLIHLGTDITNWDSIEVTGTPHVLPNSDYYYKDPNSSSLPNYTYNKQTITLTQGTPKEVYHSESTTWYGKTTYISDWEERDGQQVNFTHSVKADFPINVDFIGYDQGAVNIQSNSGGSIELDGPILNPTGSTTISSSGSITGVDSSATVGGRQVQITAGTGIGTPVNPLATNVQPPIDNASYSGMVIFDRTSSGVNTLTISGVWAQYGFAAGQQITVSNTTLNNNSYTIASISGATITLQGDPHLTYENKLNAQVTRSGGTPTLAPSVSLSATSSSGDIYLDQVTGDLAVNQIQAESGGNVSVTAQGSLRVGKANDGSWLPGLVSGGALTLTAQNGGVGESTTNPLQINSGVGLVNPTGPEALLDNVTVSAKTDVFLKETTGDLNLYQVSTGGNVWIGVPNGNLIDANKKQTIDERKRQELIDTVWSDLQLTDSTGAQDKIQNTKDAFAATKQKEYATYWQYRTQQANADQVGLADGVTYYVVVDPSDPTKISLAQTLADATATTPVLIDLTPSPTLGADHSLVLASDSSTSFTFDSKNSVDGTADTISIGANTLTTGTAVVYKRTLNYTYDPNYQVKLAPAELDYYTQTATQDGQDQGLSGQALTDFVNNAVQTIENSRTIQYHTVHSQFAAYFQAMSKPFPTTYDPGFVYDLLPSEDATITASIKVWTEDELLNTLGAGLLKSVSSTVTTIEDPNIIAQNITLVVGGAIGINSGQTNIDVSQRPVTMTEDQRVTLAAAERTDVSYLGFPAKTVTVDFTHNNSGPDTITRTDGGNWVTDGFTAGMTIEVLGNTGNQTEKGKLYQVASVSSTILTLAPQDTNTGANVLVSETQKTVEIAPVVLDPTFQALSSPLSLTVNYQDNGYSNNAVVPDTITRTDGGSWITDGYLVGDKVQVTETATNTTRVFTLTAVSADVLTLSSTDNLLTKTGVAIQIARGVAPIISTIQVDNRDDVNFTATGILNATAGLNIYLGSTTDIKLGLVHAGTASSTDNSIRIKGAQNLIDAGAPNTPVVIGGDTILEAGQGSIGSSASPLLTDLVGAGTITARAFGPVYLTETSGDMNIESVYSQTDGAFLVAQGSILDALNTEYTKVKANKIVLTAQTGTIGSNGNALDIEVVGANVNNPQANVTATAYGSIWLNETTGDFNVRNILSYHGDVNLTALLSILDAVDLVDPYNPNSGDDPNALPSLPKADIIGNNITLTATLGGIGYFGNDVDIDSSYSVPGIVNTSSNLGNTYIIETAGDLSLGTVSTGSTQVAFITAWVGSIVNGLASGFNVISGKTYLVANTDIGKPDNFITAQVGFVEGKSTTGSTYLDNTGALTVGGVIDSGDPALYAPNGSITVVTHSPVDIIENNTAAGEITYVATDKTGNNDYLVVHTGVTLDSTGADVLLQAGDDLTVEAGATILASTNVTIQGDYQAPGDADPDPGVGSIITINGTINCAADQYLRPQ